MSSYLKTICDIIFDSKNFLNEIIWERFNFHADAQRWGRLHDTLLFYAKDSSVFRFIVQRKEYDQKYIDSHFKPDKEGRLFRYDNMLAKGQGPARKFFGKLLEPKTGSHWRFSQENIDEMIKEGKIVLTSKGQPTVIRYLDEMPGHAIGDVWTDIPEINSQAKERLGYPTQKPKALLERIIQASSNEGDTVLDAFCGCGTTIDAAEALHRNWIGIDISPIAISLIKRRLKDTYAEGLSKFEVRGTPADEQSAIELWKQNPFAFQDWWLTEFEVFSTTFGTKGADKGVDGLAQYLVTPHSPPFTKGGKQKGGSTFTGEEGIIRAAFQVKGGHIQSKDIDALLGAMEKQKCELGVFLTIEEPTKPMLDTVAGSGFVEIPGYKIPKLQILTLKDYFKNKLPKLPSVNITFKAAQLKGKRKQNQIKLEM